MVARGNMALGTWRRWCQWPFLTSRDHTDQELRSRRPFLLSIGRGGEVLELALLGAASAWLITKSSHYGTVACDSARLGVLQFQATSSVLSSHELRFAPATLLATR